MLILPETTENGPAWLIVINDVVGRHWLKARRDAAVARPEPDPTTYNAATGTALRLYHDPEREDR